MREVDERKQKENQNPNRRIKPPTIDTQCDGQILRTIFFIHQQGRSGCSKERTASSRGCTPTLAQEQAARSGTLHEPSGERKPRAYKRPHAGCSVCLQSFKGDACHASMQMTLKNLKPGRAQPIPTSETVVRDLAFTSSTFRLFFARNLFCLPFRSFPTRLALELWNFCLSSLFLWNPFLWMAWRNH